MTVFLYTSSLYKLAKHICMNSKSIRLTKFCMMFDLYPWVSDDGETIICLYDKENKKSYVSCRRKHFIIMTIHV